MLCVQNSFGDAHHLETKKSERGIVIFVRGTDEAVTLPHNAPHFPLPPLPLFAQYADLVGPMLCPPL